MFKYKQPSSMIQPENISLTFDSLIRQIEEGIIKIPQFQRSFVWDKEQSAQLLDSVLKGYPIGSFTLWETKEVLRTVRNIGDSKLPDTPEGHFVQYVLDGQQRITSLYAAFKGLKITRENKKVEDFSEIYIDLEADFSEKLVITDIKDKEEMTYIKLEDLLSGGSRWRSFPDSIYDRLEFFKTRFITFSFSAICLKNASLEVATEAFTRLNVGGKQLTVFEIMCAKTYEGKIGFDLAEKADELVSKLNDIGYGTITSSSILQLIAVLKTGHCARRDILGLDKYDIISSWDKVVDSIERAVDYLRLHYNVKVSKILPHTWSVIPFAYFFYHHPDRPTDDKRIYLQDYFWRAALYEHNAYSLEYRISTDVKKMKAILQGDLPVYEHDVNLNPEYFLEKGKFTVSSVLSRALICLYATMEPKSFVDNTRVTLDNDWLKASNSKNYHHFFPKSYLKSRGMPDEYINHVLNITLVDDYLNKVKIKAKAPSQYIMEFSEKNPDLDNTLKTHLINDVSSFGIFEDDYNTFLLERARAVCEELKKRIIQRNNKLFFNV